MEPLKKCLENVTKLLARIRCTKKSVFYAFYGILGEKNYQIRYLGIFSQIWKKLMTAVSRFSQMDPVKKCPEKFTKLLTRTKWDKKSVFYDFYGILGARNYQIPYLGIFNQIWKKSWPRSHDLCQMDPVKKCPYNITKFLTRIRLAKKSVF